MSRSSLLKIIYRLLLGISILVIVFLSLIYSTPYLSSMKFPPIINFIIGTTLSLLFIAYIEHEVYHREFSSVRDALLRSRVVNTITLFSVLLTAELSTLIFLSLYYLRGLPLVCFLGVVAAYFVLSMLVDDALIYAYVRGFGSRVGRSVVVRLISDGKYNGFAMSTSYHDFVIVMHPERYDGGVVDLINAHEGRHAMYKHALVLGAVLFLGVSLLVYFGVRGFSMVWAGVPLLAVLLLVLARSLELHADRAAYERLGPRSLDYFRVVLGSLFGVDDARRAPIRSRVTHPGRRDLVFLRGDVIGAYAPWEFPLLASLFAGFLVVAPVHYLPGAYLGLVLLVYVGVVIGSFLLTILLGVVFRPVIKLFSGDLSNESVVNLSMMGASVFTVVFAAFHALYLVYHVWLYLNITAALVSFLILSLISWLALRSVGRAFVVAVVLTVIFIALNFLLYSMLFLVHAYCMHVLFRGVLF